jgi:hypothetical protein
MSDNDFKNWALYGNNDEAHEEKIYHFLNMTVIFSIKPRKNHETILSFTDSSSSEFHRFKVKGSVDYAKKIAENTVKEFYNIPIDLGDIDLCLKKAFSLRKTNTRKIFPHLPRRLPKKLNY